MFILNIVPLELLYALSSYWWFYVYI